MPLKQTAYFLFLALVLGGCVVSTPFEAADRGSSPGYAVEAGDTVVVALTHAILHDDDDARDLFVSYVEDVERTLPSYPGFIGQSKRIELLGTNAWTMSVWRDQDSMRRFVNSEPHASAMRKTFVMMRNGYVAQKELVWDGDPPDWDEALAILAEHGREIFY